MMSAETHTFTGPVFLGKDLEFVEEGFVVVEGAKIVDCGEGRLGGGKKRSIIPAFINAHTHVGDYFLREKCFGSKLEEVCGKGGIKENLMSFAKESIVISGMTSAISEMLRTGTCRFSDFREGGENGITMLKTALSGFSGKGIRAKILGRPSYPGEPFLDRCDGYGARSVRAEKMPVNRKKLLGIHVCEARCGELEEALDFRPDFLVHMNSADKGEIKKAASEKIPIVICPRSNNYFGLKQADIRMMLDEGIHLSLGTDNAMTNSLSMMSELEFTFRMTIKGSASAKDILKMATVNPAKLFRWNSGFIEKGADANVLLFDKNFLKTANPYATAVLRMGAEKYDVMLDEKYVHNH